MPRIIFQLLATENGGIENEKWKRNSFRN